MEYYSATGKRKNAICSNMDTTRDYHLSEVNQKEKDEYHRISFIYGI